MRITASLAGVAGQPSVQVPDPGGALALGIVVFPGFGTHAGILKGALEELVVIERCDLDLGVVAFPDCDLSCEWTRIEMLRTPAVV